MLSIGVQKAGQSQGPLLFEKGLPTIKSPRIFSSNVHKLTFTSKKKKSTQLSKSSFRKRKKDCLESGQGYPEAVHIHFSAVWKKKNIRGRGAEEPRARSIAVLSIPLFGEEFESHNVCQ